MGGKGSPAKAKDLRDAVMLFKVTPREKEAIEKFVKGMGDDWTVSEYIRVAVLFDMISSGDLEALSIVSGSLRQKLQAKMRQLIIQRPGLIESDAAAK